MNDNKHQRRDDQRPGQNLQWDDAPPAARIPTWRQRLGLAVDFPLFLPSMVEWAMVAEIAELRAQHAGARWTKVPPNEQGDYWHWTGDEDHAPMIYHVMWSGTAKKCFLSIGQYDITEAIWCDKFGGWWMPIEQPSTPDRAELDQETGS